MESLSSETKGIALDILEDILSAIEKLEERTKDIHSVDDFLWIIKNEISPLKDAISFFIVELKK
jgi:uncharacterized protein (UPF0335 family)